MVSSAQRGAYYKARTKRWLESKGYQVADLERVHWIFRAQQPALATKRDQFASDLLAVSARSVIFVQCKGASAARGNFPDARRKFAQFSFPPWTRQWVIAWPARSRAPRIVEMGARYVTRRTEAGSDRVLGEGIQGRHDPVPRGAGRGIDCLDASPQRG